MFFVSKETIVKNFKSTSALFMLLLVPCGMFAGVSEVASSVAQAPVKLARGIFAAAQYTVDGVAQVEGTAVKFVTNPFVAVTRAGANFLDAHQTTIFRMMSLATLAGAGYYMNKMYKDNCPMSCKKACLKK
jgi:hypothetical protein